MTQTESRVRLVLERTMRQESARVPPAERDLLDETIKTLSVYCGVVLLSFVHDGQGLGEQIAQNFVARGMICTQSIFTVWNAGSEQDAWILFRSLVDRLFHLHHLRKTDSFSAFEEYSFLSIYEARHQLLSDPDMRDKVPSSLKERQRANKSRYNLIVAKQPRWHRPKAEDVAKEMDLGFLYRFGYDYASTHTHPMFTDGEIDFATLVTPPHALALPDSTVVRNSILVQSLLIREVLIVSKMRWHRSVSDFLDQIHTFLDTGDQQFLVTMLEIGRAGPDFRLCKPAVPGDGAEGK